MLNDKTMNNPEIFSDETVSNFPQLFDTDPKEKPVKPEEKPESEPEKLPKENPGISPEVPDEDDDENDPWDEPEIGDDPDGIKIKTTIM